MNALRRFVEALDRFNAFVDKPSVTYGLALFALILAVGEVFLVWCSLFGGAQVVLAYAAAHHLLKVLS